MTAAGQPHGLPHHVRYVLIGGACGGFVSWVYSETVGTRMALPIAAAIAACFVLGAAAALISVYVVANSDVNNIPRLLAFAVICGIFWKPVLDSSVTYVNQRRDAASSDQRSSDALQSLQSSPAAAPAPSGAIAAATDATTELLKTSNRLRDPQLEEKARERTAELIDTISAKAKGDPDGAAMALEQVKTAAEATGNPELASKASVELSKIDTMRVQSQNLQIRPDPRRIRPNDLQVRPNLTPRQ